METRESDMMSLGKPFSGGAWPCGLVQGNMSVGRVQKVHGLIWKRSVALDADVCIYRCVHCLL